MKNYIFFFGIVACLGGCDSFAVNRKVEIRRAVVAEPSSASVTCVTTTQLWWQTPYTNDRDPDNPWDNFNQPSVDQDLQDLEFFKKHTLRWPEVTPKAIPETPEDANLTTGPLF